MTARSITIGFLVLAAASAVTACNEHNGVRPQADAPEWRVATADRGKLTAPVTVEYRWLEKPDRRTPGKLDLRVSSQAEGGELAFDVRGAGGAHVVSDRPEGERRKLAGGASVESEYRVETGAAGDGSVTVTATVTAGGRSLTRVVTIPLPGGASSAEKPVETDADGERIRPMPAENGPETSDER